MESVVKIPYIDHVYIISALSKHYYSFVHTNPFSRRIIIAVTTHERHTSQIVGNSILYSTVW